MCARDTGIYLGIFISFAYIFLRGRFKADRMISPWQAIFLFLIMFPMIWDGGTSYLGLRETNNSYRLFTGTYFGMTIPLFLVPAANFKIQGHNNSAVLEKWWELPVLLAASSLCCLAVLSNGLVPWLLISTITVGIFIFTIGRVVYTIVARTYIINTRYWLMTTAGATLGILGIMFLVSSFILQPLKRMLL